MRTTRLVRWVSGASAGILFLGALAYPALANLGSRKADPGAAPDPAILALDCQTGHVPASAADRVYCGENSGDNFGNSVAGLGDLRGPCADTGCPEEAIIGAHSWAWTPGIQDARVYVPHKDASPPYCPWVPNPFWYSITVSGPQEYLGPAVESAGDVNNDGRNDFIVGGPETVIYSGRTGAVLLRFRGESYPSTTDDFGFAVAGLGDLNGDGRDDVAISAPFYNLDPVTGQPCSGTPYCQGGRVYVFYCPPPQASPISAVNATVKITGPYGGNSIYGDVLGFALAGGDIDADGQLDLIMGAPFAAVNDDIVSNGTGRVWVLNGTNWAPGTVFNDLFCAANLVVIGEQAASFFGHSLGSGGDFNNGGKDDLIVGAPYFDVAGGPGDCQVAPPQGFAYDSGGKVYLFHSEVPPNAIDPPCNPPQKTAVSAQVKITGTQELMNAGQPIFLGHDVNFAGDVDHDGLDDVIIGAPYYDGDVRHPVCANFPDPSVTDIGAAYLVYGFPGSLSGSSEFFVDQGHAIEYEGENGGDAFGFAVDGHGFATSDEFADLIIGAPGHSSGRGAAYVFFSCDQP